MVEITRSLARQLRAVIRRAAPRGRRGPPPPVLIRANRSGLLVRTTAADVTVEYRDPTPAAAGEVVLPSSALADLEGRDDAVVRLEARGDAVTASWSSGVVPQTRRYDAAPLDAVKTPPPVGDLTPQPAGFLKALADAADTAATTAGRYALDCLQLRGKAGQVVATDGKQLLVQSGFRFPWRDDVLVPAVGAFGCRELAASDQVSVGCGAGYVTVAAGRWQVRLAVNADARYPDADAALPRPRETATTLVIDPEDARFLLGVLPSLPGRGDENAPVTVEAGKQVAVRARAAGQAVPTEALLSRSGSDGPRVSFACDRVYLSRALTLGLVRLQAYGPDRPVVCRDDRRVYVWQPLDKEAVVETTRDAVRLSSAESQPVRPRPRTERPLAEPALGEEPDPDVAADNGHANGANGSPHPSHGVREGTDGVGGLIAELEGLRELLRDGYTRAHHALAGLKRYRRQARTVRSALASLRQLEEVTP